MNPTLQMACRHCGAVLRVAASMAGKQGKCPKCSKLTTIAPIAAPAAPQRPSTIPTALPAAPRVAPTSPSPAASAPVAPPLASLPLAERAPRILAAFRGRIEPVARSKSYQSGVAVAAVVMLLLPLLYVLIVAGVVALVCAHGWFDTWMLSSGARGKAAAFMFLLYLAPIIVGAIVVFFMLKPIFAKYPPKLATRSLRRQDEPLLFAFVDRVCDAVHAPRPTRIDIDCDVNASASFRRGMFSFFGHDLVLTIGLPLTAGLTLTEFGGVLAHEFGHFSQGAAMRLSYVMRSITFWFMRAIDERDVFDAWLEHLARSFDLRIGFLFYLAMGGVWISRLTLMLLMYLGIFVCGILMREMEFDADQSEIRFAGSHTFPRTSRKLRLLGLAFQTAMGDAYKFYQEGRLADNLPRLTIAAIPRIPSDIKQKAVEEAEKAETGRLDTHPCDRERIERATAANQPGVFAYEEPASLLFTDFEAISRLATMDHYTDVIGVPRGQELLHSVEDLIGVQSEDDEGNKALERVLGDEPVFRLIPLPPLAPEADFDRQFGFIQQAREYLLGAREGYLKQVGAYRQGYVGIMEAQQRYTLLTSNAAKASLTGDGPLDANAALLALQIQGQKLTAQETELAPYEKCVAHRIWAALSIYASGRFEEESHPFSKLDFEVERWLSVKRHLDALWSERVKLELSAARLSVLLQNYESSGKRAGYLDAVTQSAREVGSVVHEILHRLGDVYYPFEHRDPNMTVARFFWGEPMPHPEDVVMLHEMGVVTLDKFWELTYRLTARLALIAEQVETALGLPQLPNPPPSSNPKESKKSTPN